MMTTSATRGNNAALGEAYILSELLELPYRLVRETMATFGRDPTNSIVLPTPLVSRRHARIEWGSLSYAITDMGSTNGTNVNGELVTTRRLADGDKITIGPFEFVFRTHLPLAEAPSGDGETIMLTAPGSFSGQIVHASLLEVWQMIELNQKTGVLEARSDERRGTAHFSKGVPLHAECGPAKGNDAALEILAFERGSFRFTNWNEVKTPPTIRSSSSALLLEATRRIDEGGERTRGGTTRIARNRI